MRENVALAPYTTFGIGGPARWFVEAEDEDTICDAVMWARDRSMPVFVLGGGSNLLVSDAGFAGMVLHIALKGVASADQGEERIYRVAAGENWNGFVQRTVSDGCAGIECLAGIPGTVGGTPVQNVGAYGQEVAETIERVRVLDLETMRGIEMTNADCRFAYRSSLFNTTAKGQFLVTRVDYRLKRGGRPSLKYADVRKAFAADAEPSLAEVAAKVREIRQSKGMLLVEGDPDCRSAGSFFKNPVISKEYFADLTQKLGVGATRYPAGEGQVKLPAAWLIEHAGFAKGFSLSESARVTISTKHTLALVNRGGATATDVLELRDVLVAGVKAHFGIVLEMEPILVGF
ncbi:UDP-N-acetylmuramate dehydrogenase [Acidicapsa dinghuensis]|uniref:UDP-N-acetylenolpyruvoylglucosamine reductase n=1 Tax=Acidicapsa dinghuensis TaxID=2218256 RepID=A0ABW1EJE4_9BACT|nr:UDP-N-acetylmuramate dehydrogenase [Acidicapsa dinghuensis]